MCLCICTQVCIHMYIHTYLPLVFGVYTHYNYTQVPPLNVITSPLTHDPAAGNDPTLDIRGEPLVAIQTQEGRPAELSSAGTSDFENAYQLAEHLTRFFSFLR